MIMQRAMNSTRNSGRAKISRYVSLTVLQHPAGAWQRTFCAGHRAAFDDMGADYLAVARTEVGLHAGRLPAALTRTVVAITRVGER